MFAAHYHIICITKPLYRAFLGTEVPIPYEVYPPGRQDMRPKYRYFESTCMYIHSDT